MTRNNLGDHLSWLLSTAVSKPPRFDLPSAQDTSNGSLSQSAGGFDDARLDQVNDTTSQIRLFQEVSVPVVNTANAVAPATATVNTSTGGVPADHAMGRLASASKSKRPSLAIKQQHEQQLLTPSSLRSRGGEVQRVQAVRPQQIGRFISLTP